MRIPLKISDLEKSTKDFMTNAISILQTEGIISPTGFILDENENLNLMDLDMSSEEEKYVSLTKFQIAILKFKAKAAWVFAESWIVITTPEEDNALQIVPSEHENRIEAIMGVGCNGKEIVLAHTFFSRDMADNPIPSDNTTYMVMELKPDSGNIENKFFPRKWDLNEEEEESIDLIWDKLN